MAKPQSQGLATHLEYAAPDSAPAWVTSNTAQRLRSALDLDHDFIAPHEPQRPRRIALRQRNTGPSARSLCNATSAG